MVFSAYYIIYANEADEKVRFIFFQILGLLSLLFRKLRRFRAVPTVEMLRTTWEKTTNPYVCISSAR